MRLNRAVAVGAADRPQAGLAALAELDPKLPRYTASVAYLHERAGDLATAARLYVEAAAQAHILAEATTSRSGRPHCVNASRAKRTELPGYRVVDRHTSGGRLSPPTMFRSYSVR